jgi:hypothetical protein
MPVVRRRSEMQTRSGPGWTEVVFAGSDTFGVPVPMKARRYTLDPAATGPRILIAATEAMTYVAAGSGTAVVGAERFGLEPESMLWLGQAQELTLTAGPDGLDVLVAQSDGV